MRFDFETDGGIGTRATLGAIVLASDHTLEPELARIMAGRDGIALYHNRIPMNVDVRPDTLQQLGANLPDAARLLPSDAPFDVIALGCTSAASVLGSDKVAEAINSVFPDAQVTDPLAALIAAGRHMGIKRLGFLSPYVAEVSQTMRDRLNAAGFEITCFGSFDEANDHVVARISEGSIKSAVESLAQNAPCEAIIVSCTNLRGLAIVPNLEKRLGLPVLTSNMALAWHMLTLAGCHTPISDTGRLFAQT